MRTRKAKQTNNIHATINSQFDTLISRIMKAGTTHMLIDIDEASIITVEQKELNLLSSVL